MIKVDDTIAGIATAPGEAGVGIIRISGPESISIADSIFRAANGKPLRGIESHFLTYGWMKEKDQVYDEVLVSVMRAPKSYTAEDVVEINSHGGVQVTRSILNLVLAGGARMAEPGEFTQRAFLNGRMDLTQVEAVQDLIHAKTGVAQFQAINQLRGKLYQRIDDLKEKIVWVLSLVNATIDFSEEDEVFTHKDEVIRQLNQVELSLVDLIDSAETGRVYREGYKVVLMGEPNVGKSSLLNALLKEKRSIVTHIPGTTRDIIEEYVNIQGLPVAITDTAGIRKTEDVIEMEGIERAFHAINQADLILWVIDSTQPSYDDQIPEEARGIPVIYVLNKKDLKLLSPVELPPFVREGEHIYLSAKQEEEIEKLREILFEHATGSREPGGEQVGLTNLRQKKAAQDALECLLRAGETLEQGFGEEYLSIDLNQAVQFMGEIVGETTPDDMLGKIFSEFCIGK